EGWFISTTGWFIYTAGAEARAGLRLRLRSGPAYSARTLPALLRRFPCDGSLRLAVRWLLFTDARPIRRRRPHREGMGLASGPPQRLPPLRRPGRCRRPPRPAGSACSTGGI